MRGSLRTARTVAANELRRIGRHPELLVFGLILPVIIITLIGLTFGSSGAIELGVLDRDGTAHSAALVERLGATRGVDLDVYAEESDLRRDVRSSAIQAGLVIPAGYAEDLAAGDAELQVVVQAGTEGVASALAALDGAVTEVGVEQGAIRFVADRTGDEAVARELVAAGRAGLEPVAVVDLDGREGDDDGTFAYTAPANLVLFVFINTFAVSTVIAVDRKGGQIRRMLSTPNPPGGVLLGIAASRLAFALVQSALIVGVGALAFGVDWGDPVAALVLVALWAVVSAAVGVLAGSLVSDADQAQAVGIPIAVGCGMLGGCMWPLEIVPEAVRIAGHVTPHAWVMDAWMEVMFDDHGLRGILPNLAVLAGIALVLGALATRALRRSLLA